MSCERRHNGVGLTVFIPRGVYARNNASRAVTTESCRQCSVPQLWSAVAATDTRFRRAPLAIEAIIRLIGLPVAYVFENASDLPRGPNGDG